MSDLDESGHLYAPAVRAAMAHFTHDGDTGRLEAAAALRTATAAVERLRAKGAHSRGLSSGALDLLVRLSVVGPEGLPIGGLAVIAGVSPRNATGLVDTLEKAELVERRADPDDRRSVRAVITRLGRGWVDAFRTPSQVAMGALFRDFTDEEVVLLRHLCLKLADNADALPVHGRDPDSPPDRG
ncbi:MarR family transcriptional regulator [Actinosynnema sp. NPDC020468]|uniref:MarR family winged helix-turn-helix transcriptional regulator n=1 Tax=Actinosynnema sp. NPDC020468 TaxID=3154488 RepID=UPI0033E66F7C